MIRRPHLKQRPGVVTTIVVLAVTGVVMAAFLTLTTLSTSQLTQGGAVRDSEQTYLAAEAGINQALNKMKTSSFPTIAPFSLNASDVIVTVDLEPGDPYGRIITAHAVHPNGQERRLQITVNTSTFAVGLNYAVHAGAGGLLFNNGGKVYGEIHSNGSALPVNNGDQGEVLPVADDNTTPQNESLLYPGNLTVSGAGNRIEQMLISGLAWADTLRGTNGKHLVAISAKYNVIGPANPQRYVYAGATQCQTNVDNGGCDANAGIAADQLLPIGTTEIVNWANDIKTAANGGTLLSGNQNISGNVIWTGPTKVTGNITFDNNATLTVTGSLWVTGTITLSNNSDVTLGSNALIDGNLTLLSNTRLDLDAAMGEDDGVIILGDPENPDATDGKLVIQNGVSVEGSGHEKSSLTLISTNTSLDENSPAIDAANTATGIIYFGQDGIIRVRPTGDLNAVYANKVYLDTNAKVTFKPTLQFFSIPNPNPAPIGIQPGTWNEL